MQLSSALWLMATLLVVVWTVRHQVRRVARRFAGETTKWDRFEIRLLSRLFSRDKQRAKTEARRAEQDET